MKKKKKKKGNGARARDKREIGQKESGRGVILVKEGVDVRREGDSDTCEETRKCVV